MIFILIYFVTCAWAQPAELEENSINGLTGGAGMILSGCNSMEELHEYHSNDMSPNHHHVNHLDFHSTGVA